MQPGEMTVEDWEMKAQAAKKKIAELTSVLDDDIYTIYQEQDIRSSTLLQLQIIRLLRQLADK